MLTLLRTLAKALTGKVDALEFSLGIALGVLLGLVPMVEVDPGTGMMGLNTLWLFTLAVFLVLKASIPMGLLVAASIKLLAILFLDAAAFHFGRSVLDGADSMAVGLARSVPGMQLHTYWGFGSAVIGLVLAVVVFLVIYPLMKKRLPAWRERFGKSKVARALGNFFVFKMIGRLIS